MHVTMDRYEADWAIVQRGWEAHVLGEASNKLTDAVTAVRTLRVRRRGRAPGLADNDEAHMRQLGLVATSLHALISVSRRRCLFVE